MEVSDRCRFTPGKEDRKLVGARAGLDAGETRRILCPYRESNPGRPARSPSLYRLSSPGLLLSLSLYDIIFMSLIVTVIRNLNWL
jgi:hypothetical protein